MYFAAAENSAAAKAPLMVSDPIFLYQFVTAGVAAMKTRRSLQRFLIALLPGLAVIGFSTAPASAAFIPLTTADLDWQYEAPAGTTITGTPGQVFKTYGLTLTTTFTDSNPIVLTLRTRPGVNQDERFFMFSMNVTNADSLNRDWVGFVIKTLDQIEVGPNAQDPNNIKAHPKWAHIHPNHSSPNPASVPPPNPPKGPNYTNFTLLDPDVSYGVEVLTLGGGTVFEGDTWSPDRIRLHDKNFQGDDFTSSDSVAFDQSGPMEFQLVLQPIVVPEPGSLLLLAVGLAAFAGVRSRRDRLRGGTRQSG